MEFQVKCQVCFKKIPIKSFKGISKMFQGSFLLQFCFRMYLIAATRAEGGLVVVDVVVIAVVAVTLC